MSLNIGREITVMKKMTVVELRGKYAEVFGEGTTSRNKEHLIHRIVWRLQSNEEGGLSERALRRAAELAAGADVRLTAPRMEAVDAPDRTAVAGIRISQNKRLPMPGATITREYKGRLVEVHVLPKGFEYEGEVHRSLTAVAKAVTGTHWNGYGFFRLGAWDVGPGGRRGRGAWDMGLGEKKRTVEPGGKKSSRGVNGSNRSGHERILPGERQAPEQLPPEENQGDATGGWPAAPGNGAVPRTGSLRAIRLRSG